MSIHTTLELIPMFLTAFLIGIVLACVIIVSMHWCRVAYERGTWAAAMVAISAFYIVFAIEHGIGEWEHILIATFFTSLAVLGARFNTWLIVVSLVGHGIFDAFVQLIFPDPSPEWWGPFCISVDIVLGGWLAVLVMQNRVRVS